MLTKRILCAVMAASLAACARSSSEVTAAYVPSTQYGNYTCDQIAAELHRVNTAASKLGGRLDEAASDDKVVATAGVILFWPALFILGGTKKEEAEFARLKGESDALRQAAIQKKCSF